MQTRVLALVFCAWVEASFSKIIHTPYGFTLEEIDQIKWAYQHFNLETGWKKSIELGLRKISSSGKSNYKSNIQQKISSIVDDYVVAPSVIRNRVAHGQWKKALNNDNTAVNNSITNELGDLNAVVISKWFRIYEYLLSIIETLIESPNRAFHRDYWQEIAKLEDFLKESKKWNIDAKIKMLRKKPIKR